MPQLVTVSANIAAGNSFGWLYDVFSRLKYKTKCFYRLVIAGSRIAELPTVPPFRVDKSIIYQSEARNIGRLPTTS